MTPFDHVHALMIEYTLLHAGATPLEIDDHPDDVVNALRVALLRAKVTNHGDRTQRQLDRALEQLKTETEKTATLEAALLESRQRLGEAMRSNPEPISKGAEESSATTGMLSAEISDFLHHQRCKQDSSDLRTAWEIAYAGLTCNSSDEVEAVLQELLPDGVCIDGDSNLWSVEVRTHEDALSAALDFSCYIDRLSCHAAVCRVLSCIETHPTTDSYELKEIIADLFH